MGKPKKGKAAPEPQKPFTFDINNFQVERTRPGLMRLLPVIPDNFDQVCFKLRILKNYQTGKPKYEMSYYECSLLSDNVHEEDGRDMRVFSLVDAHTGKTFIVDPKKTQGRQPFLALDPITNKEEPIEPHLMIQHDVGTGKNYLLDVRKFEDGKLEFKDPLTKEVMTADLMKRADPLSGKPLQDHTEDVTFVGAIKDGEMYITKCEDTGELHIVDNSGNTVDITSKGYHSQYDVETNLTTILDENEQPLLTVEGEVHFNQPIVIEETPEIINDEEKEDKKFEITENAETGEIEIRNEKGELVEPKPNHYYTKENPDTGELTLVDNTGQPVNDIPEFKIIKDKTGKSILVDKEDQLIPGTEGMIINEEKTPPVSEEVIDFTTPGVRVMKGPLKGQPIFVTDKNKVVPSKKIFEVIDPMTGKPLYFDKMGNPVKVQEECPQPENDIQDSTTQTVNVPEDKITLKPNTQLLIPIRTKSTPLLNEEKEEKTDEEKYFEDLDYDEAREIVAQVNAATQQYRPVFLKVLMQVIELNRNLIRCALEQKFTAERKFAQGLLEEKEQRQVEFIKDLIQLHSGDYDKTLIQEKVNRKQTRENNLLLDKLEARIVAENNVVMDVIKRNMMKDSRKIIKYTNIPCYHSFKVIVYKELSKSLGKEVKRVKNEVCELMRVEKENTAKQIEAIENANNNATDQIR